MAIEDLITETRAQYGVTLSFDDQGRCVLTHDDDTEILVALRDDGRALFFAISVAHVDIAASGMLFAGLLAQNIEGRLAGAYSFALDVEAKRVVVTHRTSVEETDAEAFMATLNRLVAMSERAGAAIREAQSHVTTLDDAMKAAEAADYEDDDNGRPTSADALV